MADKRKFAFQCKNCGAVEPAEAAGENEFPAACHACRHGVHYEVHADGTGFDKIYEGAGNWTKLADLTQAQLKKGFEVHGLTPDRVAEHAGFKFTNAPDGKFLSRVSQEKTASGDAAKGDKS